MIADSSVIILFARLNKIGLLKKPYASIEVTESVYEESVEKGAEYGHGDAAILKKAFDEGHLRITKLYGAHKDLSNNLQRAHPQLGKGETDTIALAIQNKTSVALIDEHPARIAARLQGVKCTGTVGILLAAFSKGLISKSEAKALFNTLIRENIRISAAIAAEFYDALERTGKHRK